MDGIKDAFQKVKQDIFSLKNEINDIRNDFLTINNELFEINNKLDALNLPTHNGNFSTNQPNFQTHKSPFKPLKSYNSRISTGNEGVQTDRQTDRQTDTFPNSQQKKDRNSFEHALKALESLDSVKKEIRLKFKRLTEQEFLVFTAIYQLGDEGNQEINYSEISKKLSLTESSIRDYVGNLIKKGIPIEKHKINNKTICLSISQNLKKIAPLSTILQLRDL